MILQRSFLFILISLGTLVSPARAVLLDWDAVAWTAGSLSNSYDIDPSHSGNDVTVTISGSTGQLRNSIFSGSPATPAVTTQFAGGLTPTPGTLNLALDLSNSATQAITLTLNFSNQYGNGIYDLVFTIFDVDYSNASGNTYQDQVSGIYGTTPGGAQVAPVITTSANNALSGSGLTQVVNGTASTADSGASSANGNVVISFGNVGLSSFTFTYGNSSAFANPTYQHIGFYDFSYSPVPELNPAMVTAAICVSAIGLTHWRRRRVRLTSSLEN